MKRLIKFELIFFLIGVVVVGGIVFFGYLVSRNNLLEEKSENLLEIVQTKTGMINDYLGKMEEDIQFLKESDEVKEMLKKELVFDEEAVRRNVEENARIIAKEVENYLRENTGMTLRQLQKSPEFQELIIQPVSKDGFTFAFDSDKLICYFHKENERIGYDYNQIENISSSLWRIFKEASETGYASGFYKSDDPNGDISEKFSVFIKIPIETADGISLTVGTTAQVGDYKVFNETSRYLENFKEENDYYDLVLISSNPQGYVGYMSNPRIGYGANLEWLVNQEVGLAKNYSDVREIEELSFFGPYIGGYGDIYPKISVMAPVHDSNALLGYITLIEEMDHIFNITKDKKNLGEKGQTYLINEKLLLISPLRNQEFDIMVQTVDTENSKECIEDLKESEEAGIRAEEHEEKEIEEGGTKEVLEFLNYEGDLVLGKDMPIGKVKWCLLSEIDKEEILGSFFEKILKKIIYFSILGVFLLILMGFFVRRHKKRWKESEKFVGKIVSLVKLRLCQIVLISAVLSATYLIIVNLFLGSLNNFKIIDYLAITVGFMIFFKALSIKDKRTRLLFFLGSIIYLLQVGLEVVFKNFTELEIYFSTSIWILIVLLGFIAFILFLLGFKRLIK